MALPFGPQVALGNAKPSVKKNGAVCQRAERPRKVVASYSNPMLNWIFQIASGAGMRSSEIAGLYFGRLM